VSTAVAVVDTAARARRQRTTLAARAAVAALVVVMVYGAATTRGFVSADNAKAILSAASFVGILAVGTTLIMLSGSLFSMSIGTTTAVTSILFLYATRSGLVVALVVALAAGAAIFAVQGVLIGSIGANPIIVTIGAGALQEGATTWRAPGNITPPAGTAGLDFLASNVAGIPFSVYVFVAVAILGELAMRRTRFGIEVMLLGENRRAARAAALPVTRIATVAFAVAGACAAITGILVGAFNQNSSLQVTGTFTFDAIAAALVGGTAVNGGYGAVWRAVLGAVVIAVISDMLLLRGYSTGIQILVKGVIVMFVVVLVQVRRRGVA
jgi:ribose/xylose/arabinose/galactoside ABC-type transport system permease subunit